MIIKEKVYVLVTKDWPMQFYSNIKNMNGKQAWYDSKIKFINDIGNANKFMSYKTAEIVLHIYDEDKKKYGGDIELEIRRLDITYEL